MKILDNRGDSALRERAYKLAENGRFSSVHQVEQALIAEGWPNVGPALKGSYARKAIAERCEAARTH
jgi:hypothetical protein